MPSHRCAVGIAAVVLAALSISCGSSGSISAPSSPAAGTTGATIVGTFNGSSHNGASVRAASSTGPTITVTVVGTTISATIGPGESFTLNGVPTGNVTLQVGENGSVLAQVMIPSVQSQEQIRVTVSVKGSSASITITERTEPATSHQARVQGPITSINTGALTFIVDGVTVSVPATAVIRGNGEDRALTFAALKVGARVTVSGSFTGATLVASEVDLTDGSD